MKTRLKKVLSVLISLVMCMMCIQVPVYGENDTNQSTNRTINMNRDWKFYLGDLSNAQSIDYDDSTWQAVNVPHDFSISQDFTTSGEAESGFLSGGTGWYRKSLVLDSTYVDKSLVLNFDGVYSDAYVYINGQGIGEHHYGYSSFAFDISDYVTCDGSTENIIAVKVMNNTPSSRWYSGSGIYRDVNLIVSDKIHVANDGTYVTTPDIKNGTGTVQVAVDVMNDTEENATLTVKNTVYTQAGETASETVESSMTVNAGSTATVTQQAVVNQPKLWSTNQPNLYYVHTELVQNDIVLDSYDTTFGFRYYEFNDNAFYLNGKALKLNGVCLHHDQGALGAAAYNDAMYRQLSIMKDMGVNAVRTSHNPADKDFIRMCNELGLLVIEEAFDGWELPKNGNSNDFSRYFNQTISNTNQLLNKEDNMTWAEFAIKAMVRRDRNAPSVILWSLGNEVQEGTSATSDFASIATNLINWVKEVDTTRQTTIGSNQRTATGTYGLLHSAVKNNGGIVGFNYASSSELSSMHNAYGPIIASETSSAINSRGIYSSQANASNVDGKYHLTSYDTSKVGWGKTAHDSLWDTLTNDYVAGEFVWTGFDYIGEPTPWNGTGTGSVSGSGAIPNSSYFGIVDTAGFEKDTYYLYRSQWNQSDTTLHLVTAWDSDNMLTTSGKTPVVIYSNAPKVELYRDNTHIGTAIRKENTTSAGHHYYTYTVESNNDSICDIQSGNQGSSLYATFNVAYQKGTISAKAYDENNELITKTKGTSSISTPDTPSQLKIKQDKTEIDADGSSLTYIEVEVQDENGNLDTIATNLIKFDLTGDGIIAGVDNGDQATTKKYQQKNVLTSSTSAQINAYAGKALAIVRSTTNEGSLKVNITSDGLDGGEVNVKTNKVLEDIPQYNYKRDYSVKINQSITLDTTISRTIGNQVSQGTITWDQTKLAEYIQTAGNYRLLGTATFDDGTTMSVNAYLHVIDDVVAMRNISTVTSVGTIPTLPTTVKGILQDGSMSEVTEFPVKWESMESSQFNKVGDIVLIKGTATVINDETLPVTASVRVGEAVNTESKNVATNVSSLTQDIAQENQSDNLSSINNGTSKPGDNTNERWTNWGNRTNSSQASITMKWDTAQLLSDVNIYYYFDSCAALPENVKFEYSLNGEDFINIDYESQLIEEYSLGAKYNYKFVNTINPVALRITFTQQDGTTGNHCIGVTEIETMTFSGQLIPHTSADLSAIEVDGNTIDDFMADKTQYAVNGETVTASSDVNAGITILPEYEDTVYILTVSEDGMTSKKYEVTLNKQVICQHQNTKIINAKNATCTEDGYTGDRQCQDCLQIIQNGEVISALGHQYDQGVITLQPTHDSEGVKTYTCTVCGDKKTETIAKLPVTQLVPTASVYAQKGALARQITLIGQFDDYENVNNYVNIIEHGIVYYSSAKLGTRTLTVNTPGRTKVRFTRYASDGTFKYTMTPSYASTAYTVRSYLAYIDEAGRTYYIYSKPIRVSYNTLDK